MQEITAIWWSGFGAAWAWFAGTGWGAWLTSDATGQRVGLGVLLLALVVGLWLGVKFGRALVKRCRYVPTVLLAALGAYYASVLALRLEPGLWAPAAALTALTLLVLGLVASVVSRAGWGRRKQAPRGGRAKAGLAAG